MTTKGSSQVKSFGPVLRLKSVSVTRHIVGGFQRTKVSGVIIMAKCGTSTLRHRLTSGRIVFLQGRSCRAARVFSSIEVKLRCLGSGISAMLFAPMSIPLFATRAIARVLSLKRPLIAPIYGKAPNRPVLVHSSLVRSVLDGSKGANLGNTMRRYKAPVCYLGMRSPKVVRSTSAPRSCMRLLHTRGRDLVHSRVRVRLTQRGIFFSRRLCSLLALVRRAKSIHSTYRHVRVSCSAD